MVRIPAHRRRRDPYARQIPGVLALKPQPDCVCEHKWAQHQPRDPAPRGYCLKPDCPCLAFRPEEQR